MIALPSRCAPALALAVLALAACYDPVHLDAVAALGPEEPETALGPEHRAGQPCTTCHGGNGPADLALSVAGTLYSVRGTTTALAGGLITITGATGESRQLRSNAAGNFFIEKSVFDPAFPLRVVVEAEGLRRTMITSIGRDGGCAACHRDAGDATHVPGVFLRDAR